MKSYKIITLVLLTLTLAWAAPAFGQSDRGTITGTVRDPNGAAVVGAKVTATDLNTNEARDTTTSGTGDYTIPELKADPYRVTVEAQGFSTENANDIKVAVQTTRRVDFTLQIGAISNVVTVSSQAETVIQTDSPERQTNVNERQVKELPLEVSSESAGRTPLAFIFLDSNVASAQSGGAGANGQGTNATRFRVSGGQALGTEILIDGASTRREQNGTFFSEVAPGPNAFQEFTLSTSTFSAEFGQSSGGIVNFTLKSGGNEFHGEAYDLLRNEDLNANSFLNNASGLPRNRDNENDFGFNVGGPIYLPRFGEGGKSYKSLKNRGFFFFNYEGYRFALGENVIVTVPTARMRQGDFSELLTDLVVLRSLGGPIQIYDPRAPSATRLAIPGNRLDQFISPVTGQSVIDPAGFNALQFFPLPNRPGVFHNFVASSIAPIRMNQVTNKFDFVLSDKHRLAASYSYRNQPRTQGGFPRFPEPFVVQGVWDQIFKSLFVRLQDDYTFSPKLINHINIGFTRYDVANRNFTSGFVTSSLGIPANATNNAAFPRIGFPGYGDPVLSGDPRAYQDIGSTFFTDRIRDNQWDFSDVATYVRGRHTMRFGGDIRPMQFNVHQLIDPGGSFNFRADQTAADRDPGGGWPIASLITGATEFSFATTNSIDPAFRQLAQGYFFQDDIKVTPRLTLNLGLRYDLPGLRYERLNRYRNFDPNVVNPVVGRPGALVGAGGQSGLQAPFRTLAKPDHTDVGPRVGFAYSLNNLTVVRGGIGIYYAPVLYGTGGGGDINSGTIGYNTGSGPRTPDGRNARFFLSTYPPKPPVDPNGQFIGSDVTFFDPNFKSGRTIQYSLDIQRQLPWKLALDLGYIGHRGTRLRSSFSRLNALPLNDLRLGFTLLEKSINDVNDTDRAYAQSVGVTIPAAGSVFPGFNGSVAQALRPFPQYGNVTNELESRGRDWYNAGQVKVERRFAGGIQFGASYTFSKLITDASEDILGGDPLSGVLQNPFDIRSLRAVSANNPTHVVVFNYLVELPFGKGRRFLNRGGWVDKLVGGFQFSGIQRYQSGLPLTFFTSDPNQVSFLNDVGYGGNIRLNATGQPFTVSGAQFDPARNGIQVINPAAFALPPNFESAPGPIGSSAYAAYYANPLVFFGTLAPVISNVRTVPFLSENLNLLKKTRIFENLTLELGAEAFNIFNRHRFFAPTTDFNDRRNFGFQSVGVGTFQFYEPRVIQLRARVIF